MSLCPAGAKSTYDLPLAIRSFIREIRESADKCQAELIHHEIKINEHDDTCNFLDNDNTRLNNEIIEIKDRLSRLEYILAKTHPM